MYISSSLCTKKMRGANVVTWKIQDSRYLPIKSPILDPFTEPALDTMTQVGLLPFPCKCLASKAVFGNNVPSKLVLNGGTVYVSVRTSAFSTRHAAGRNRGRAM